MAARTRLLQVAIGLVNFLIFMLAFTSLWPFPNGDFKIDLPEPNEVEWSYGDGRVDIAAPYSVDNGGYYDVEDLVLSYSITNLTGAGIASDTIEIGTLPAGEITSGTLEFYLDLMRLYEQGAAWMIFNDDALNMRISVSCLYTMGLIEFDALYSVTVPWDALIRDFEPEGVSWDPDFQGFTVTYRLDTSPLLNGMSCGLTLTYLDDGVPAATATQNVVLGQVSYSIHFDIVTVLIPDAGDSLRLELDLDGFEVEQEMEVPL